MEEREYVESSVAAFLKAQELPVSKESLAERGSFRVVSGVYDFDTGFFEGAVDLAVDRYEEALSIVSAHRGDVLAGFTQEIMKIRRGVREGNLTGTDPLGAVSLLLSLAGQGGSPVRLSGFSVAWDFQRASCRELYAVDWPDDDWDLEE